MTSIANSLSNAETFVTLNDLQRSKMTIKEFSEKGSLGTTEVYDWTSEVGSSSEVFSEEVFCKKTSENPEEKKAYRVQMAKMATVVAISVITFFACTALVNAGDLIGTASIIGLSTGICEDLWNSETESYKDIAEVVIHNLANLIRWLVEVQAAQKAKATQSRTSTQSYSDY